MAGTALFWCMRLYSNGMLAFHRKLPPEYDVNGEDNGDEHICS
jgi:hypothetical protein